MKRILYLDSFGKEAIPNLQFIPDITAIRALYERYFYLENPEDLALDCRGLSVKALSVLLKFIEEYPASITLVASDPVPKPVLSRFIEIKKYPLIKESDLRFSYISRCSRSLQPKLCELFGIKVKLDTQGG
jgi:hypothetical protein